MDLTTLLTSEAGTWYDRLLLRLILFIALTFIRATVQVIFIEIVGDVVFVHEFEWLVWPALLALLGAQLVEQSVACWRVLLRMGAGAGN